MTVTSRFVVAVALSIVLAGCLGTTGLGGEPGDLGVGGSESGDTGGDDPATSGLAGGVGNVGGGSAPGPEAYPEPPATLTAGSVGAYVAAYEEVYREVYILQHATVDVTEVGVDCTPVSVSAVGDDFRVVVECGSWYEFEDGDHQGIADGAGYTAVYVVGPERIERLDGESTAP